MRICSACGASMAVIVRPKNGRPLCHECFYEVFENEIHETIITAKLFSPGDRVAIGASGGKDSTVLAHVLWKLNKQHNYGLDLFLLSIDEGISGYRDDSLDVVEKNREKYGLPLKVLSYKELYGWTMDEIVKEIGKKSNCTFCGVFRRQALDRGAALIGVDHIVTGHNADDVAETIIMNIMRGDVTRLIRTTSIKTNSKQGLPRSKPLMYTYQKEIVLYAYFKNLNCFTTECTYSNDAYRGNVRSLIKKLESISPRTILDIIYSGEQFHIDKCKQQDGDCITSNVNMGSCKRCGYMSSNILCKACSLLDRLNRGLPACTKLGTRSDNHKCLIKNAN